MKLCLLFGLLLSHAVFAAPHAFDDLNAKEITEAMTVVRESKLFDMSELKFAVVRRMEPPKNLWLAGKANDFRQAYLAVFDFKNSMFSEVIVDLKQKKILNKKDLKNIKPPVFYLEYQKVAQIVRADERWQKALQARGLKPEDVWVDSWAPGLLSKDEKKPQARLIRTLTYFKGKGRNFYSRPVEGLVTTTDLTQGKVVGFWDITRAPVPQPTWELDTAFNKASDWGLKPLQWLMPRGSSVRINGQEVSWAQWKFRYSVDPLQGVQIYDVRFRDGEVDRKILYKMSLAEMFVPYGDGALNWSFRNAFDAGEYGLGKALHPLVAGADVPSTAQLIDTVIPDEAGGEPQTFKGMAIYERPNGILWKHRNAENGDTDIRSGRELVITFMTTVGNYDYGINYIFKLDGTIEVDAQLTGILLPKGTTLNTNPCEDSCLTLVEKNIIAPPHQHFFNFRMDFDIDGVANTPAEMNVVPLSVSKLNPAGNAFGVKMEMLPTEKLAVRDWNVQQARKWKVLNSQVKNSLGHPIGYELIPGEMAVPYLSPKNQMRRRAQFINHNMWFTVYHDDEMSGAAMYPTTAPEGEGLPKYIANNEGLKNKDVVMWYTFGVTHIPRPEEWPIMNTHHTGFTLVPSQFFNSNPAMKIAEGI